MVSGVKFSLSVRTDDSLNFLFAGKLEGNPETSSMKRRDFILLRFGIIEAS